MPSLTRDEARRRAQLITVTSMEVHLDLTLGEEWFGSTTRIRFTCHEPGAGTWVDFRPVADGSLTLNGEPVDPEEWDDGRIPLRNLRSENIIVATGVMRFSRDGQGLHRAVDPADGEAYVYGHLFLDAAPRVFGCFDQPDLKSPYAVTVTAPEHWTVLGNGAGTSDGQGRWTLAPTKPLATYFMTVCAGPWASLRSQHDGIRLRVHARRSLAEPLAAQADQMFDITRRSFDFYHELFGIRFPFGTNYDQVFVPEFNAGAMENPGCVTFRESLIARGASGREEVIARSMTIAHEMAHMWFGDLVTMRWWDDLWLNESFAEYMAHRTLAEATEFTGSWADFTIARKLWGYAAERTPSTHPVAGAPAPDGRTALTNFDGISYAKGASVIRQLIAHIGDDAFLAGVRDYLAEFSYRNGALADFVAAMERASGRSLAAWGAAWLETAGADVLAVDRASWTLTREVPADHPADRPHSIDIGGAGRDIDTWRSALTVTSEHTELPEVTTAQRSAPVVLPNASDLTWASIRLDPDTLAAAPEQLGWIGDDQLRIQLWTALIDGVYRGEVDPRTLVAATAESWPRETNVTAAHRISLQLLDRVIPTFLPEDEQAAARAVVADAAARALDDPARDPRDRITAARVLARSTADADLLARWVVGDDLPDGLAGDADFRWLVIRSRARLGLTDATSIDAALADDETMTGHLAALGAHAALPGPPDKARAWGMLTSGQLSNHESNAVATDFWTSGDEGDLAAYVPKYFTDLPALPLGTDALARLVRLGYPGRLVSAATEAATESALACEDLAPGVRRAFVDSLSELREALASRQRYSR